MRPDVVSADGEQDDTDERERRAAGRDVEHGEERAEEHQRRADLARHEQHRHRRAPHEQQRSELLHRRDRHAEDAPPGGHQQLAVVAQVGREEDHDRDLAELGGLEADRADVHREVGAVDLAADPGQPRQQHAADPAERDQVAVVLERQVAPAAEHDDRRREQRQPDDQPLCLLARERRADPVDHHDPDARQRRGEREEVGVRVGQGSADHEVPGEAEREEHPAIGQRDGREAVVGLDEDRREAARDEEPGGQERQQLAVAGAEHGYAARSSASLTSASAAAFCSRGTERTFQSPNALRAAIACACSGRISGCLTR